MRKLERLKEKKKEINKRGKLTISLIKYGLEIEYLKAIGQINIFIPLARMKGLIMIIHSRNFIEG